MRRLLEDTNRCLYIFKTGRMDVGVFLWGNVWHSNGQKSLYSAQKQFHSMHLIFYGCLQKLLHCPKILNGKYS